MIDHNDLVGNANLICSDTELNVTYFSADCGGDPVQFECSCCTTCHNDGDASAYVDFYGNSDPSWQANFQRAKYEFGQGIMFMPPN